MSKATIKIYRTARVPTEILKGAAGLDRDANPGVAHDQLVQRYAPFAPRLRIFWPSTQGDVGMTIVGMEAQAFSVEADDIVPRAGLVNCDPVRPEDVSQIDGALHSELERMGVYTTVDDYEWRAWYEVARKEPGQ